MRLLKSYVIVLVLMVACKKSHVTTTPDPVPTPPADFIKGADISWLTQMESTGKVFYNSSGVAQDCMQILKGLGMNAVRFRVWVNPAGGWNNKADVLAKALRAKALGLRIMIDFHYSDSWADPSQQTKPAAWNGQDFSTLRASVYSHTTDVLTTLKNNNVGGMGAGGQRNTGWNDLSGRQHQTLG